MTIAGALRVSPSQQKVTEYTEWTGALRTFKKSRTATRWFASFLTKHDFPRRDGHGFVSTSVTTRFNGPPTYSFSELSFWTYLGGMLGMPQFVCAIDFTGW